MECSYCYVRRLYKRFKWNPEIRFDSSVFTDLINVPDDSRIFVGSTFELFTDQIPDSWRELIVFNVKLFPKLTFIFLTKCPQNLAKWSPFSKNCWVGVSATNKAQFSNALYPLKDIKATVKFISFEPLLERIELPCVIGNPLEVASWVIIGQQTPISAKTQPKIEWVQRIVEAADKAAIPIFLKYNLVGAIPIDKPFYRQNSDGWAIRQEGIK